MNKQQLASKIWASANNMRSKIEASTYKDFILGFIFYMFLSDKEEQFLIEKVGMTKDDFPEIKEEDEDLVKQCQQNIGYFISYKNLFSRWLAIGKDFTIQNVTEGLSAFNRLISEDYKMVFNNIFSELETGLTKLGDTDAKRSKEIVGLINLIKDIPTDNKQGYDVLGFIYEYLIGNFAASAGKKAGEFYTPHEVSLLMAEIVANHLRDNERIEIYDPTSGSGSLLLNIGRAVSKHIANKENIKYYAQELKASTYNLTRMNLVMRGIMPANIEVRNADTLEEDWPKDERNGQPTLYLDAVVSNPPYSQHWNPKGKELDPRYLDYGIAPKGKADYAFLLHDLYHLKPNGIMTIVLPHGVLFRGDAEGEIRKNLIESNHIDAIIGLPSDIFFGTGIATIIMVLRQKRDRDDILFVDASHSFIKSGKKNKLRASDIRRIVDAVNNREELPKFSRLVTRQEIRDNEYNLNLPRYIDSSEPVESYDLYSTMYGDIPNSDIAKFDRYWEMLSELKEALFEPINPTHSRLKCQPEDIASIVAKYARDYMQHFNGNFQDMDAYLREELIAKMATVNINKEEGLISQELFQRITPFRLFDKYDAYQLLDDNWQVIETDLEVIHTEGWDAVREVEPNMILKKKKDENGEEKEVEVQDGWKGKIMPYDLVQKHLLTDELKEVHAQQDIQANLESRYNDLLEAIKNCEDADVMDEAGEKLDNTAFKDALAQVWVNLMEDNGYDQLSPKEKKKKLAELQSTYQFEDEESAEYLLVEIDRVSAQIKQQKKVVKSLEIQLLDHTRDKIKSLTDEEAKDILNHKWIEPIYDALMQMPQTMLASLSEQIRKMSLRYADTLLSVGQDISTAEGELKGLLGELTGTDEDMAAINELKNLLK